MEFCILSLGIFVYNFSWDYFGSVVFEIYSKGFILFLASYW